MSNPEAAAAQAAHQALIEQLDIHSIHKTFRNPHWRPNQRRNKNIKTILGDASRKEASLLAASADDNGTATPQDEGHGHSGTSTPAVPVATSGLHAHAHGTGSLPPNLAQASRSLSKLVLEKSLQAAGGGARSGANGSALGGGAMSSSSSSLTPTATYTNIESAPSLAPLKHYCDITGLPAPYMDPQTRMRYYNQEVFAAIRNLPPGMGEQFLEARGAQTVLK